jgi:hypothetical protein
MTLAAVIVASAIFVLVGVGTARAKRPNVLTSPPPDFKEVSTLVNLPEFLPGLGRLYVNPSSLPVGPFLGYDKSGKKLVNITYMVPVKDLEAHKNMDDLGANLGDVKIDHTDIEFNPGHPGVQEAHYHIIEWLITRQEQESTMK